MGAEFALPRLPHPGGGVSYRVGIGPGLAAIGFEPREPALVCDGCGVTRSVMGRGIGCAASWFLDGKAAPGWSLRREGEKRSDFCPKCKATPRAAQ